MKLPTAPLLREFEAHGGLHALLVSNGVPDQSTAYDAYVTAVRRAKESGHITVAAADKLSVDLLARHPSEVYGEDWWAA